MGYAPAGLLGIGIGFRVGFFGLVISSALAFCAAFGALFLTGEPVLSSLSVAALHLLVFEMSVFAGMAVRHGLVGTLRETTVSNHGKSGTPAEGAKGREVRALF